MFLLRETQKSCIQSTPPATASAILIDALHSTHKLWLHPQLQPPSEGFFFQFGQLDQQEKETLIKPGMQKHAELCPALLCVEMNGGSAATYVAKASSLAKALIKLLTVFPTKPPSKGYSTSVYKGERRNSSFISSLP